MQHHGVPETPGRGPTLEPSGVSFACTLNYPLSPLPPPHRSPVVGECETVFCGGWIEKKNDGMSFFLGFQIGMMAEMARVPPNLDQLMNEGIAFVIDQFKDRIPRCPVGKRPVMIGNRKQSYNTIDKVMRRLDLVMKVMEAMNFVIIDIH